jgi:chemotaxis protein histidine kinase CheA
VVVPLKLADEGEQVGLVIDTLHQPVDVIVKPLVGVMTALRLFSGTALLGDSRRLLISLRRSGRGAEASEYAPVLEG